MRNTLIVFALLAVGLDLRDAGVRKPAPHERLEREGVGPDAVERRERAAEHEAGDLMSRITNDMDTLQQAISFALVNVAIIVLKVETRFGLSLGGEPADALAASTGLPAELLTRWRDQALMFASADLRRAPVEFFSTTALASRIAFC